MRTRCSIPWLVLLAGCGSSAGTGSPDAALTDAASPDAASPDATPAIDATSCVAAAHARMPAVTLGAGAVLQPVVIVSIIPGNFAAAAQNDLIGLGHALATDGWYTTVGADYELGAPAKDVSAIGPAITIPTGGLVWTKAQAEDYITSVITASAPALDHTGRSVYLLYAPVGLNVDSTFGDSALSPSYHSGFPASYNALGDAWAPIQGAAGAFQIGKYSVAASHELIEAATDTGNAWALRNDAATPQDQQTAWLTSNDNLHAEIGDLCSGTRVTMSDGFVLTRVFSNRMAAMGGDACLPIATGSYDNTTPVVPSGRSVDDPTLGWTRVAMPASGNAVVDIPIVGWTADGSCASWAITANAEGAKPSVQSVGLVNVSLGAATISTGATVTLHVEVPAGSPSGSWGSVNVHSAPLAGDDKLHDWVYAVYVE